MCITVINVRVIAKDEDTNKIGMIKFKTLNFTDNVT